MNHNEALIRIITLLVQEYQYKKGFESINIGKDIFDTLKYKVLNNTNGDFSLTHKLLGILESLLKSDKIDVTDFLNTVDITLADYNGFSKIFNKMLKQEFNDVTQAAQRKKLIMYLKKEKAIQKLQSNLQRLKKVGLDEVNNVINETKEYLDEIADYTAVNKGEAIVEEVDFDSDDSVADAVKDVADLYSNTDVLKTGWECINEMTAGGLRRGELVTIAALPHNYKSGFTKSLFLQLARLNKPKLIDPNKKPLMIFFSVEEDVKVILGFFYAYFKFLKEGKHVSTDPEKTKVDPQEMKEYLVKHLRDESNFHLKLKKLNPITTSYKTILDIIDGYSKQGYETVAVFIDYLSEINKEGCVTGPAGAEYKDLFKKVRAEMGKRKILCVTPHQISTEAKRFIRNGIPNLEFVKHLQGKGYYAHSSQLDQEIDLELFLHKAAIDRKPVLTVQRGKHRLPNSVLDADKLYTILKFPRNAPIPETCDHFQPCMKNNNTDDEFDF